MNKIILTIYILIITSLGIQAQNEILFPVKYKMKLSGSFGELRTNHFHSGIDIKGSRNWNTNKAISVMDGYISRITVKPTGYGNAIYINHPNGLTSVYGHLNNFSEKITEVVRKLQYENETFSINPDSLNIPVKKGEIIGQIGNTGRSFGTHLHFELRNTETEHPVNPFSFGIKPKDNIKPTLTMLKIVALDSAFNELNSKKIKIKKSKNGNQFITNKNIKYGAWRVGLEVLGYDQMYGAPNKNGIYSLAMKVNGELVYNFNIDSLDFSKQKCLNAHIDYKEQNSSKKKYNRLYILPGNGLDIYTVKSKNTIISLYKDKSTPIEIIAKDFHGNTTNLKFNITRDAKIIESKPKLFNHHLKFGKEYFIKTFDYKLKVEKSDLFKDMFLFITKSDDSSPYIYSNDIRVFTNYEIFKNNIDLYIRPVIIDSLVEKLCIVRVENKKLTNMGNHIIDGYYHTTTKTGGTFKLMLDTIAPTIRAVKFKSKKTRYRKIAFIIKDNFNVGGYANPIKFDGYIDDKWVLFEYDQKKNKITHVFNKSLTKGKHHLKLIVKDDRGNTRIFEKDYFR